MDHEEVESIACSNIALTKYWGKSHLGINAPATPSLSLTLEGLNSLTTVKQHSIDQFQLNGESIRSSGISDIRFAIEAIDSSLNFPPICVSSANNFPTSAGLASSASGFAALVTALNHAFNWNLSPTELSGLARRGSASAARSMFGGFVSLTGPDYLARQIAPPEHWNLQVVIAITSRDAKKISSTEGMQLSAKTSPYYANWVESAQDDFDQAVQAVERKDFQSLAEASERSCLKMHAVMQTTQPALIYWNAATMSAMHTIAKMRDSGTPVFFTIDAGPQVKAVCEPSAVASVEAELKSIPGVLETRTVGLGQGARIVD
ncbi:MAG: diphosphomevalonate decarboxylase [Pseudomonadota bacterium]